MPDILLSVVVPAFNEEQLLEKFLIHTYASLPANSEIIVVDGGSSDKTYQLATSFSEKHSNIQVIQSPKGRALQMNTGADRAKGQYLLFLHVDTFLPNSFPSGFYQWAEFKPAWGFASLKIAGDEIWCAIISAGINLRTRISAGASGDQALVVRSDIFSEVLGYKKLALMEDIDLSYRLRRRNKVKRLPLKVETSGRRWREQGVFRTIVLMWFLRIGFLLGVCPEKLAPLYRTNRERKD